jgi:hypothetical protein
MDKMKLENNMLIQFMGVSYTFKNTKAVAKLVKLKGIELLITDINFKKMLAVVESEDNTIVYTLKIIVCDEILEEYLQDKLIKFSFKDCKLTKIDKYVIIHDLDIYAINYESKQYQNIESITRFIPNTTSVYMLEKVYLTGINYIYKGNIYRKKGNIFTITGYKYNNTRDDLIHKMLSLELIA